VIAVMPQMRLLVAVKPVDLRKGIDGLVAVCREELQAEPFGGALFIFAGRNRQSIKILAYDGQGYWLCQKRLSQGRYNWWPAPGGEAVLPVQPHQLQLLLWNGDPTRALAAPLWRPVAPAG